MVEVIGSSSKYPTKIPSLGDNADIQTALRVYHYGQASEPATIIGDSIAGHFKNLEDTKVDIDPFEILNGESLNNKTTTGYYNIATDVIANSLTNKPTAATAGMLQVIQNLGGNVFQQYFMTGTPNKLYWRSRYNNVWSTWVLASDSTHSHNEFTSLSTAIDGKQAIIEGAASTVTDANLDASKVLVSDGSGKIRASADITTTELGYLNGATSQVQTTILGNKAAATPVPAGIKRMVIARDNGSGAPDATFTPVEGDLWFW